MMLGCALITSSSLAYFDFDTLPPFVVEKLPVRFEALWLASLRVHVATALVTFPSCLLLTTRALQRRAAWHRWLGRFTGILVLVGLVPSGAVLAFDAKGGPVVTVGFLVSAVLVAWFMVGGIVVARRRDLVAHRRAMRHVVAQMSVAVSSRILLVGFDALGVDPDRAYVIALWVPVILSAAIVEIDAVRALRRRRLLLLATSNRLTHLSKGIRRESSPLGLLVRARLHPRAAVRRLDGADARLGR
jgi:uncharacterized membrane protein YozB (DUF420 family)